MTKRKIKVTEVFNPGSNYFAVEEITSTETSTTLKIFTYKENGEEIWSREKNLQDALIYAKTCETNIKQEPKIIYQTPD
jgi:hypothetical protein